MRNDLDETLRRIDALASEIEAFVPANQLTNGFRADLAGLLVVAIAASYETCVKLVLTTFAERHHLNFGLFTRNHFGKLNSRINLSDLDRYAAEFGPAIQSCFGAKRKARRLALEARIGRDIDQAYKQILRWRHSFAHAGARNTTVEEVMQTHLLAKRVLYTFSQAFEKN
jgi:hypothetical protein